jgi:hypothetical protein
MIPRAMLAVTYATGRASHARQVKSDDTKKGYPGPPGWGFGMGLTTPHSKKLMVTKVEQRKNLEGFNDDGESWRQIEKNGGSCSTGQNPQWAVVPVEEELSILYIYILKRDLVVRTMT